MDQNARDYLKTYLKTRAVRPDWILDIERADFNPNTFYRITCLDSKHEPVAYCAARRLHFPNHLELDAKLLLPPHPVENWNAGSYIEIKGQRLDEISGETIYLGGLWVRKNIALPQVSMILPRLLAGFASAECESRISWVWGIFDTNIGEYLASSYGFDDYCPIEVSIHHRRSDSSMETESLPRQALSWARPSNYVNALNHFNEE